MLNGAGSQLPTSFSNVSQHCQEVKYGGVVRTLPACTVERAELGSGEHKLLLTRGAAFKHSLGREGTLRDAAVQFFGWFRSMGTI